MGVCLQEGSHYCQKVSVIGIIWFARNVLLILFRYESKLIVYGGVIRALTGVIILGANMPFLVGVTFLTFVGSGHELTTKQIFTTLALVNTASRSSTHMIRCFFQLYECSVAIKRLQVLLTELKVLVPMD